LLVIPTIYDILSGWRERVAGWLKERRSHAAPGPVGEPSLEP
jgi:hypothetical protein